MKLKVVSFVGGLVLLFCFCELIFCLLSIFLSGFWSFLILKLQLQRICGFSPFSLVCVGNAVAAVVLLTVFFPPAEVFFKYRF